MTSVPIVPSTGARPEPHLPRDIFGDDHTHSGAGPRHGGFVPPQHRPVLFVRDDEFHLRVGGEAHQPGQGSGVLGQTTGEDLNSTAVLVAIASKMNFGTVI